MKKCWKQVLLFVMVAVAAISIGRTETKAATIVEKGSCGDSATYTLDSKGTLTISGSGEIGRLAFADREDIKKVVIQKNITGIGEAAFGNSSLTSITIPDGVTSIEDDAFEFCISLTSITIPDSVTSIGNGVFCDCGALKKIKVATGNPVYDSRNNCNAIIETATNSLLYGCQSTIIPNSVASIGRAFVGCRSLTSIAIPNSVTSIEKGTFSECYSLKSVVIPNSVTSIGNSAFRYCKRLTSITIPNSVTSIGASAFEGCSSLKKIIIPKKVTCIEHSTFYGCSSLTSIIIPDSMTSIGGGALEGCSSLTSIILPASVTNIGSFALGYGKGYDAILDAVIQDPEKIKNFTIYGTKGSAAETYAKENGFTFKEGSDATASATTKLTKKNTTIKLSKKSYVYDGKAKRPDVKVLNVNGKTLKKSNYTVRYTNNVKVGKATAVIKFKGKYSGTIKVNYTIRPKTTSIRKVRKKSGGVVVTWKRQPKQADGYQLQYATDKTFTKAAKSVAISKSGKVSKTLSGLDKNKNYYFRIRTYKTVNGKNYYSSWSKEYSWNGKPFAKSYKAVIQQQPKDKDTKYTLYDIDKDGTPELLISKDDDTTVYTYDGKTAKKCGDVWSNYNKIYEYDGNGLMSYDGGRGWLHLEYIYLYHLKNGSIDYDSTIMSTEECSYEELRNKLKSYTEITNFYEIDDTSLLDE